LDINWAIQKSHEKPCWKKGSDGGPNPTSAPRYLGDTPARTEHGTLTNLHHVRWVKMEGAESSVFLADKIHMSESTGWLLVQVESLTDEGFFKVIEVYDIPTISNFSWFFA